MKKDQRIKDIESKYKLKLVKITYFKGIPCYHFKALEGNELKEIFEQITHKGGEK